MDTEHPERLNIWVELFSNHFVVPLPKNLNEGCLELLEDTIHLLVTVIRENYSLYLEQYLIFQQGRTPPHFVAVIRVYSDLLDIEWHPQSSDKFSVGYL